MIANIITIGDEILIGQTLNSNAAFIGSRLTENQIGINKASVVADDENAIKLEFKETLASADVVLVTGGLGPTHDDVTKKCITDYFKSELVFNEEVLNDIEELFKQRGREVTEVNRNQAYVPEIAEVIKNSKGTAPGMWVEIQNKIFIAMPGVPIEMREMFDEFVLPKLKERNHPEEYAVTLNLMTSGIPESYLYERLGDLEELLQGAKLAFLPNQFGVKMRITAKGVNEEEANNKLTEVEQKVRGLVGRFIYGKDEVPIEQTVARLLIDRGLTLAVAESCTGGLISNRLTNVNGSSAYFERGLITYSNGAKVELLKVNEDIIEQNGAVSLEVARQMAEGVKAVSGTDLGLAVTGIMGPGGASPDKPVGLVYIGYCDEKICTAKEFKFGDDRLLNKDRTSQAALDFLRRSLLGISDEE